MKIAVTKEFTFDCAHMLSNHEGLCANLHGHTYKLQITVQASDFQETNLGSSSSEGMVIDFKELNAIVHDLIISKFDHSFICWENGCEAERELASVAKKYGLRVATLMERPTAENICKHFFKLLRNYFKTKNYSIDIVSARLWETPTSFAEVMDHDVSCC
ncbi:6-carboxytetrahydropterin synthase QueD [Thermotalea metallivorans]|uniref:6-carboxy-5,6,7,8-tetrahydropterin synthase n=1 Tax=Thermotalea metallivorans TaxID=520762 RepID=A0A140LAA6_9FIRM|nr:6-carboxytetrahydropterin synthase QueD [Thermotalea metallivorans]KXG77481.1 6-carboxy-5,6,7,8-tetrahydropterin synthase [Thermotalea metallivorans]